MIYEYKYTDEDGGTVTIDADASMPPAWVTTINGRPCRRVLSIQPTKKSRTKIARDGHGNRKGNDSLPPYWPFAEKFDAKGRPVFDSKLEQHEANRRAAAAGEFQGPRELSQPGDRPHIMRADD